MADFPGAIASDGSLLIAANNVGSTLNGGISAVAASATLASTVAFPSKGGITIESEAIIYSANDTATSVLSGLTRGVDSTTAAIHANGTAVYGHMQARHHNALKDEIIAIETNIANRLGNTSTSVLLENGTVASPSLAFSSDTDTGIYRIGTGTIGFSSNGVISGSIDSSGLTVSPNRVLWLSDGTAAAPTLTFTSDSDTGIYRVGTNNGAAAAGGVISFSWNASVAAGCTRFFLYDVDKGAISQVLVGAADSGGTGYKMLRVVN